MVICLPDDVPAEAVTGTLTPLFWAVPKLRRWQRHQMIGVRPGRPTPCAGGPLTLLDLTGMRRATAVAAGIRFEVWRQAVHGTRAAQPWVVFHARHLADPTRYPLAAAQAQFFDQPRINAMRMHNAVNYGPNRLPVREVEMFQAGSMAYQHYKAATSVCADTLLTADGRQLSPASDAFCHRVTYLEQATRHLDTLTGAQRLVAVTV